MNTYLKLSSTKTDKNCNCISPFYIDNITGINPETGHEYTNDDKDILKTSLMRISNAKGCNVSVCCDPNDPTSMPDENFTQQFLLKYPKVLPVYEGSTLKSIKLSTTPDVKTNGWLVPDTYMICKITKATITNTSDPTIKIASDLVTDCFSDQCNQAETITMNNLLQNAKGDMSYTFVDDARVTQAINEGNISYVKEYIRKYKTINSPLTNDDYNNRLIHIASQGSSLNILNMLIALKANLNVTNKIKETPIHFAVRSKNLDNIDALLTQGVDLTIATIKGETPMFYAMATGDMRIVNILYNNTAPMLTVDKFGNNLIHYCILNCPSFKDTNEGYTYSYNSISNTKSEIIKFLIDHGVSTEQKNSSGITPLELTSKEINREINKECASGIAQDNSNINEKFFNIKPITEAFNNKGGAKKNNVSNYTTEHESLLEIQTMLFNNIIRNNPNKYNNYISVDEIPKGAPIDILDTVCYGNGMSGNEDSEECIEKGGQLVKIKNKTTKIKLELIPENDVDIDEVNQKELYFNKFQEKIPYRTISSNISNYNNDISNSIKNGTIQDIIYKNTTPQNTTPQNTGITYNIGQESTNLLDSVGNSLGFNPQPTKPIKPIIEVNNSVSNNMSNSIINIKPTIPSSTLDNSSEHPPTFNDDDTVLKKCTQSAIRNSTNITQAQLSIKQTNLTIPTNSQNSQITLGNITISSVYQKYKTQFIILFVVIILLIIGIIVNSFMSNSTEVI
jgi:ankyrin repeat protein